MKIENITKKYGSKVILNNLSLEFGRNDRIAVMGKSGCGKTTLLRVISGLEKIDSGVVDEELLTMKKSMVFQENRLCERLSAVKNLKLVCNDEEKILDSLEMVGLDSQSIRNPVSELSGGMKRRVAICRAIIAKSDVLIFDEAFTGLDEKTKEKVCEYVDENIGERLFICVTHDINEAKKLKCNIIELPERG